MKKLKEIYSNLLTERKKKKDNFKTPGNKSKENSFGEETEEKVDWATGDTEYAKDYPLDLEKAKKKLTGKGDALDRKFEKLIHLMNNTREKDEFRLYYLEKRKSGEYDPPKNEKFDLTKKLKK